MCIDTGGLGCVSHLLKRQGSIDLDSIVSLKLLLRSTEKYLCLLSFGQINRAVKGHKDILKLKKKIIAITLKIKAIHMGWKGADKGQGAAIKCPGLSWMV